MSYEYNDFVTPLNDVIEELPKKITKKQREKLSNGIDNIKKVLPLLKNYIEQADQDDALDNIKTGTENIRVDLSPIFRSTFKENFHADFSIGILTTIAIGTATDTYQPTRFAFTMPTLLH